MAIELSSTLPDEPGKAAAVLQTYISELGWGLMISLGPDGKDGFDLATSMTTSQPLIQVAALWAKDPNAIKGVLLGLQNGAQVNFGGNGHRLVGINKLDQVSRCLSTLESKRIVDVLGAYWCAARDDKACDF